MAAVFIPSRYHEIPVPELLRAAARGWIGVDARLIRAILSHGESAAAGALAYSRESQHREDRIGIDPLLTDLFRHFRTPEALDFLIDRIRRAPEDVDDNLIQALLPFGEKAAGPLLQLYEEVGEELGHDVAFVLAGLRVRDPRVLDVLLERLEFDAADGAFLLGLYGDPAARPALEKMFAEIPLDDPDLRREFSFALEQLNAPEPRYEPEPFDILEQYPEEQLPEFDALPENERLEMLASPDPGVRAGAANSFFNTEISPKARAALLDLARSDPEAKVRGRAWECMADLASDESVRGAMLAVLQDRGKPVQERGGAAVGLYTLANREEVRSELEALYEEGGEARAKALEAMWRSRWKPFANYFPRHLDDADPAIVREALRGAGYFRLTSHADKIASYFEREGDMANLRDDALFAYGLAMPGEITRSRARGMLRKIESLTDLDPYETSLVTMGIDERLRIHGLDPVFEDDEHGEEPAEPAREKIGRNDPCPCGSGKKFKKCHGK
ncbi:MAG TPA: SEC-C metal-binding domain-containing protein [Bryobacteraceae bacterium]|nr:SEC-C metal-binding domain-containing protein [Bryobacteraceae bacterium]